MNAAPFPGNGMRISSDEHQARIQALQQAKEREAQNDTSLEADIAANMERELPKQTAILSGRAALDKSISDDRSEEARILAIIAAQSALHRQIKTSRRAKEDMRDSMAAAEG